MFGLPGGMEWILILFIVILLFGAKKIPELMKGLGSGLREFKKASNGTEGETPSQSQNINESKNDSQN